MLPHPVTREEVMETVVVFMTDILVIRYIVDFILKIRAPNDAMY